MFFSLGILVVSWLAIADAAGSGHPWMHVNPRIRIAVLSGFFALFCLLVFPFSLPPYACYFLYNRGFLFFFNLTLVDLYIDSGMQLQILFHCR